MGKYRVTSPDGGTYEVTAPDDATQDQIISYAQSKLPFLKEGVSSGIANAGRHINDFISNLGTGMEKGLANLAGTPRALSDVAGWVAKQARAAGLPAYPNPISAAMSVMPSSEDIKNLWFNKLGVPEYQPQTMLGRSVQHTGEVVGSTPFPGTGAMTVLGSQGGNLGRELYRGTPYEKLAETGGDILGTGAVGAFQSLRSTPEEMLRRRTQGMSQQDWADAAARQEAAKQAGVPLMGTESMNNPSMARLTSDTASSAGGGPTIERFMEKRPGQVSGAVGNQLGQLGPAQIPEDVARKVETAATNVIREAEGARSKASSMFYRESAGDPISKEAIDYLASSLDDAMQNVGAQTRRQLEAFKADIQASPTVGTLHSNLKALRAGNTINIPSYGAEPVAKETAALAKPVERNAVQIMEAESPKFAQGQASYIANSPRVEGLTQGDIGRLANPNPGEIANVGSKISTQARIIANPDTARPETIRAVAKELTAQDPTAFRDLARTYLENAFNQASKDIQPGANRMSGVNFRNAIMGTPQQRANMNAIVEEVAKANGQNPDQVRSGFNVLMDTLERTGKVPALGSPTASRSEAFREAAQGGAISTTLDIARIADPFYVLRRAWQDHVQRGNFRELANALTAPNSVELLRQMASTRAGTARANAIAVQIMNGVRASENKQ